MTNNPPPEFSELSNPPILSELPVFADVCSPTDAIERWLFELTLHLATPSLELQRGGLHWNHFPQNGVCVRMPDGSCLQFDHAFHVAKDEDPLHIAVFTEEDGCHEMWLNTKCSVAMT